MKKLISLIIIIVIIFSVFIFFYLQPRNYEATYQVGEFNITEKYNKDYEYYYFKIENEDYKYDYLTEINYSSKRKLIKEIKTISEEGMNCILPVIKNDSPYPLCYDKGEKLSYSLVESNKIDALYNHNLTNINERFNNVDIYNYLNSTFLLWNYKGFIYLKEDVKKEINLFSKDVYDISLTGIVNNYLIIPNYDLSYTFNEMYIIDLKTGESNVWKLDYSISFDSYILGSYDKSIYLIDKKEKIQYELVPHKKKMRRLSKDGLGKIYKLNGFLDITTNELANSYQQFEFFEKYIYEVKNKELFMYYADSTEPILISRVNNPKIVGRSNGTVFYLKADTLYAFNPKFGETVIMKYFEWNFNYENMIYIYK